MRVFLSHKMTGLTERQVMQIRHDTEIKLVKKYGTNIDIIDNYHHDNAPDTAGRIWHLGESIKMMEEAREAIKEDRFGDFKEEFFEKYGLNTTLQAPNIGKRATPTITSSPPT